MFAPKTTFVIGAGASAELGFPVGSLLLQQICGAIELGRDGAGDDEIRRTVSTICNERNDPNSWARFYTAAVRIREASAQGSSIDSIIDQNDHDEHVPILAKLAIARIISSHERMSLVLPSSKDPDSVDLSAMANTWLFRFGVQLCADYQRRTAERVLENVEFVIFNYDRAVEQYLPFSLQTAFGLSQSEARQIVAAKVFHHPYGSLGMLPWQASGQGYSYGGGLGSNLPLIAEGIQTFSEQLSDVPQLEELKRVIRDAQRLIFLGFGFHPPNMKLLASDEPKATKIWATVLHISIPNRGAVSEKLRLLLSAESRGSTSPQLARAKCAEFMDSHRLAFTA